MSLLELPHTNGCLVCGRTNPLGLHLSLHVDQTSGSVQTTFTPSIHHIGFDGIIHGGVLATVLDEAMVWAAIWSSKRSCLAAEMTVRFKRKASVGEAIRVTTTIARARPRLIEVEGQIESTSGGEIIATASGKYVPLGVPETAAFLKTVIHEPATADAIRALAEAAS